MSGRVAVEIAVPTDVAAARRVGASVAESLGLDEASAGKLSVVITELGTNVLKHAGGGEMLFGVSEFGGVPSVEVLALDRGRGMTDVARCLADGYSTAGSPGTGLGAIARLATAFDVYTQPGSGTAVLVHLASTALPSARASDVRVGGVSVPKPGEEVCGDDWDEERRSGHVTLMVVDGLGHGPAAAEASRACVAAFRAGRGQAPGARVEMIHDAARATRGAAVAVADVDAHGEVVRFAGLGNIAGAIHSAAGSRHLISQNGTAGHVARRVSEYTFPWPAGATLLMYSDGLATRYGLDAYPGLAVRQPALVAGVLYRDMRRGRDDVTVVVAQRGAA
jgi:anti-sigma regulatory factor (Ser/Thr protein kinase)